MNKIILLICILFPVFGFAVTRSPQDAWIDALGKCESQHRPSITILDSNNKYSYGEYMFQLATFMAQGKKYDILPDDMTSSEARLLIHNESIQRAIAREMLDDGLSYNWKRCTKKIGPYPVPVE